MPRASSSIGDFSGNPWFHNLRFMDFFGSPRGEFTGKHVIIENKKEEEIGSVLQHPELVNYIS